MSALSLALGLLAATAQAAAPKPKARPELPAVRVWLAAPESEPADMKDRRAASTRLLRLLLGEEARPRKVEAEGERPSAELWEAARWNPGLQDEEKRTLLDEARKSWPGKVVVQEDESGTVSGKPSRKAPPRAHLLNMEAATAQLQAKVPSALTGLSAGTVYDGSRAAAAPTAAPAEDLRDALAPAAAALAVLSAAPAAKPHTAPPAPGAKEPDGRPFSDVIAKEAEASGIDPEVVHALIAANGGYSARRHDGGAYGLMMVTRTAADWVGVSGDLRDPALNIRTGTRLLAKLLKMFDGDINRALAAYRVGAGAVIKSGGIPNRKDVKDFLAAFQKAYRGGELKPPVLPAKPPVSGDARRLVEEGRAAVGGTPEAPRTSFSGSAKWRPIITQAAATFGVDPKLVEAILLSESEGRPSLVSPAGAKGLMQLMPGTARSLGVKNIFDPKQNIYGGTKYLKQLLDRFNGDKVLAVAAYNAGPNRKSLRAGRVPAFRETSKYVTRVFERYEQLGGGAIDYLAYMSGRGRAWAERESARLGRLWGPAPAEAAVIPVPAAPPALPPSAQPSMPPAAPSSPVGSAGVTADPSRGRSVGTPSNGRLVDGVRLPPEGEGYRSIRQSRGRFYGTGRLVAAVEYMAASVKAASPSAPPIALGDLSAKNGGDVSSHASHENGRDVDILLAWKDAQGAPVFSDEFVSLPAKGSVAHGGRRISFDPARTWLIVKGLATNPYTPVTNAFLDQSLINAVLRYAESAGESKALVSKASRMLQHWPNHKNHIHVRVQ
ncbi:MAG: penicillin-insensitive murein endopeptidase [Elusimicrobia bacterium]|nr:penicillin-insensitive murein endopeptidase [Elusimicrobiota bacterium]